MYGRGKITGASYSTATTLQKDSAIGPSTKICCYAPAPDTSSRDLGRADRFVTVCHKTTQRISCHNQTETLPLLLRR